MFICEDIRNKSKENCRHYLSLTYHYFLTCFVVFLLVVLESFHFEFLSSGVPTIPTSLHHAIPWNPNLFSQLLGRLLTLRVHVKLKNLQPHIWLCFLELPPPQPQQDMLLVLPSFLWFMAFSHRLDSLNASPLFQFYSPVHPPCSCQVRAMELKSDSRIHLLKTFHDSLRPSEWTPKFLVRSINPFLV